MRSDNNAGRQEETGYDVLVQDVVRVHFKMSPLSVNMIWLSLYASSTE